jgi:hypothetical protein
MTERIWDIKEARQHILHTILELNKPAKVYVLAPRDSGLEKIADVLAEKAPDLRIVHRYHKQWSEVLQKYPTASRTNRFTGKISVFLRTPLPTDEEEPYDTEERLVVDTMQADGRIHTWEFVLRIALKK